MSTKETFEERVRPKTPAEFRARRYLGAKNIHPLAEHSPRKRLSVNGVVAAWAHEGWKKAFFDGYLKIRVKQYRLSMYKDGEPIGLALFNSYLFQDFVTLLEFADDADTESQEAYDLATAMASVLPFLSENKRFEFEPGMRLVELERLIMRPGHAVGTQWGAPVNEFIRRQFQSSGRGSHYALALCPFPLEYEMASNGASDNEKINHRRRAMAILYRKTLGLDLFLPSGDEKWWMAKLL